MSCGTDGRLDNNASIASSPVEGDGSELVGVILVEVEVVDGTDLDASCILAFKAVSLRFVYLYGRNSHRDDRCLIFVLDNNTYACFSSGTMRSSWSMDDEQSFRTVVNIEPISACSVEYHSRR